MKSGMRDVAFEKKQIPRFLISYDGEDRKGEVAKLWFRSDELRIQLLAYVRR